MTQHGKNCPVRPAFPALGSVPVEKLQHPGPDISFPAGKACNPERRLAVGFGIAITLKADSKSALRTRKCSPTGGLHEGLCRV